MTQTCEDLVLPVLDLQEVVSMTIQETPRENLWAALQAHNTKSAMLKSKGSENCFFKVTLVPRFVW